jgi:phage terminase large subunit
MIVPQNIYKPLYTNKDKFITLVTGGRGSGKSFNVSTFIERLTFEVGHVILYTRYTMVAANISIIPEFKEKIEIDRTDLYFNITKADINNTVSGSRILFRGINTASGNQTAKLKSIQGITTFVCDEAEEWASEEDYDRIMLSIRQKGIQNRVIIIMNPTDDEHFIYKKYIENTHRIVTIDGVDVQISTHPNVLHIHTTYLDNIENLGTEFLNEAQSLKLNNPNKYAHVIIGRWADIGEGVIFQKIEIVEEFPQWCKKVAIGLDFGYTHDPSAGIMCGVIGNDLYLDELFYKTEMLARDLISELREHNLKVIADSADPRLIQEIGNGGIHIYPVSKPKGSVVAGITKMLELNIKVTRRSKNLRWEFRHYTWDKDKDGNPINEPLDANNHAIDAARYYVWAVILGRVKQPKSYEGYF